MTARVITPRFLYGRRLWIVKKKHVFLVRAKYEDRWKVKWRLDLDSFV